MTTAQPKFFALPQWHLTAFALFMSYNLLALVCESTLTYSFLKQNRVSVCVEHLEYS